MPRALNFLLEAGVDRTSEELRWNNTITRAENTALVFAPSMGRTEEGEEV